MVCVCVCVWCVVCAAARLLLLLPPFPPLFPSPSLCHSLSSPSINIHSPPPPSPPPWRRRPPLSCPPQLPPKQCTYILPSLMPAVIPAPALGPASPARQETKRASTQVDLFLPPPPPLLPPLASLPLPPPPPGPAFLLLLAVESAGLSVLVAAGDSGRLAAGKLLHPCRAAHAHTHVHAHTLVSISARYRLTGCVYVRMGVRMRACFYLHVCVFA
jgi:hypothetical protein